MKQSPANVRFWHCFNEPTKITLRPGQTLTWHKSAPHDEGYSWEAEQLKLEGNTIVNEWGNGGSDCDGPISRGGTLTAIINSKGDTPGSIQGKPRLDEQEKPIVYPDWKEQSYDQRDVFAEQMNY